MFTYMTFLLPVTAALSAILILPWWSFYFDVTLKIVVILIGAALVFVTRREWPDDESREAAPLRYFTIIADAQAMLTIVAAIFSTHPNFSWLGGTWRRSGAIAEIASIGARRA